MDRPGGRQVPGCNGKERKMKETGCEVICSTQTTLAVKEWMKVKKEEGRSFPLIRSTERLSAWNSTVRMPTQIQHYDVSDLELLLIFACRRITSCSKMAEQITNARKTRKSCAYQYCCKPYRFWNSMRNNEKTNNKKEVGRQNQGMDKPGVCQVPEGSGEQRKMKETGCEVMSGTSATPCG